jgi:hypothetical protein
LDVRTRRAKIVLIIVNKLIPWRSHFYPKLNWYNASWPALTPDIWNRRIRRATGTSLQDSQFIQILLPSTSSTNHQPSATMLRKSFFVLAAVSSCCYAQQSAADVTTGLDSIAQSLSDITTLVKAVSTTEEARVGSTERSVSLTQQLTMTLSGHAQHVPRRHRGRGRLQ